MVLINYTYNLNVHYIIEDTHLLNTEFCNLHKKPYEHVCNQNVQQLITKHVSTL